LDPHWSVNAGHIISSKINRGASPRFRFTRGATLRPPPLLRQIAKDIGMTVEALLEHR
jgi:hypothetical protein